MNRFLTVAVMCAVFVIVTADELLAEDPVIYRGAINVGLPLGRIVADPTRPQIYGISVNGEVVFMDRLTMTVEETIATGRVLTDIDIHPSGQTISVLDNITGEYWNQPPATYVLSYDVDTQSQSDILFAQASFFQMAWAGNGRIAGVQTNQWVSAYLVNATTGARLSTCGAGYYGNASWATPNTLVTSHDGSRMFRTDVGISSIDVMAFDTSGDTISQIEGRTVGSYALEPVFVNSTDSSLYVGDIRLDPFDLDTLLGMYPEMIYAATGDDAFAFGTDGIYDPVFGGRLGDMPVQSTMMTIGENDRFLYAFDTDLQQLHVMEIVPEPVSVLILAAGTLAYAARRRRT